MTATFRKRFVSKLKPQYNHESLQNQSLAVVGIQSTHGSLPDAYLSCGQNMESIYSDKTVFSGCRGEFKGTNLDIPLPVHNLMRLSKNASCTRRFQSSSCRMYTFEISLEFADNATSVFESQALIFGESGRSLMEDLRELVLPVLQSMTIDGEEIISISQHLFVDIDLITGSNENMEIQPRSLSISYDRDIFNAGFLERTFYLSLGASQTWRWRQEVPKLFVLPPDGNTTSTRSTLTQVLGIDISKVPKGVTLSTLAIDVYEDDAHIKTLVVEVTISIQQGFANTRTQSISVSRSQSEPPISRSIWLSNTGTHSVKWKAEIAYADTANNQTDWIALDKTNGTLASNGDARYTFVVRLFSGRVKTTGIFEAWVLIVTNSWDGRTRKLPVNAPSFLASPLSNMTYFWIKVDMLVTSMFICQQSTEELPLRPMETTSQLFTVVNTEITEIAVAPTNFTLYILGSDSETHEASFFSLTSRVVSRKAQLTPWLSISPPVARISVGGSLTFNVSTSFLSRTLVIADVANVTAPAAVRLAFGFGVFLGSRATTNPQDADDFRATSLRLNFEPGIASAQHSRLEVSDDTNTLPVDRVLHITVALADIFGQEPASAIYRSSRDVDASSSSVFELNVIPTGDSFRDPTSRRLPVNIVQGREITSFSFNLTFVAIGSVRLELLLNGRHIRMSPKNITGILVDCPGENQIPSADGSSCMCERGHRQSEISSKDSDSLVCVPCGEGFFRRSENRDTSCELCPQEYFSTGGSSECIACPRSSGVDCSDGQLRFVNGFWCEICSSVPNPREMVIESLQRSNPVVFHRCFASEACVANGTSFQTSCKTGYTGPVCSVCADNYAKNPQDESCIPCGDRELNQSYVICGIIGSFGLLLYLIHRYAKKAAALDSSSGPGNSMASIEGGVMGQKRFRKSSSKSRTSIFEQLIQLVVSYIDSLQILAILSDLTISPFQGSASTLVEVSNFSLTNPTQSRSFRCAFSTGFFLNSLLSMGFPWILAAVILISQIIVIKWFHRKPLSKKMFFQASPPVLVIVFNLLHASVTTAAFESLNTYRYQIEETTRVRGNLEIEVGMLRYNVLLVVSCITVSLFVFGFPLAVSGFLLKLWNERRYFELSRHYSSWTDGFLIRRVGFLWPTVVIFRKVFLVVVHQFMEAAIQQYLLVTVIIMMSFMVAVGIQPYRLRMVTVFEQVKLSVTLLSVALGAIFYVISTTTVKHALTEVLDVIPVLVLVFQGLLLLFFLWTIFLLAPKAWTEFKLKTEKKLGHVHDKIRRNVSFGSKKALLQKKQEPLGDVRVDLHDGHGLLGALAMSGVDQDFLSQPSKQQEMQTPNEGELKNATFAEKSPLHDLVNCRHEGSPTSSSHHASFRRCPQPTRYKQGELFKASLFHTSKHGTVTNLPSALRKKARKNSKSVPMDRTHSKSRISRFASKQNIDRRSSKVPNRPMYDAPARRLQSEGVAPIEKSELRPQLAVARGSDQTERRKFRTISRSENLNGDTALYNPLYSRVSFAPKSREDNNSVFRKSSSSPSAERHGKVHRSLHHPRRRHTQGNNEESTVIKSPLFDSERFGTPSSSHKSPNRGCTTQDGSAIFANPLAESPQDNPTGAKHQASNQRSSNQNSSGVFENPLRYL